MGKISGRQAGRQAISSQLLKKSTDPETNSAHNIQLSQFKHQVETSTSFHSLNTWSSIRYYVSLKINLPLGQPDSLDRFGSASSVTMDTTAYS